MTRYTQPREKTPFFELPCGYAYQMRNESRNRWFRPLLCVILVIALYALFSQVIRIVCGWCGLPFDSSMMTEATPSDPKALAPALLSTIALLPALLIALPVTKAGSFRNLSSVEGKLRWSRLKVFLPWSFLVVALATIVIPLLICIFSGQPFIKDPLSVSPAALIVILILVPAQCTAEEYAFRGLLLQAFSSWVPLVIIPTIAQSIVFGMMHGYNILGNLSALISGLSFAFLTIKTAGLEAGIAAHTANNVISLCLISLSGQEAITRDVSVEGFLINVATTVVLTLVLYRIASNASMVSTDSPAS